MPLPATFPDDLFTIKGDAGQLAATAHGFAAAAESYGSAAQRLRGLDPTWTGAEALLWADLLPSREATLEHADAGHTQVSAALGAFVAVLGDVRAKMAAERPQAMTAYERAHQAADRAAAVAGKLTEDAVRLDLKAVAKDAPALSAADRAASGALAEWERHVRIATGLQDAAKQAAAKCAADITGADQPGGTPADQPVCGPGDPTAGPLALTDQSIRDQAASSMQSAVGDCYFLSSLRGIATADPGFIRSHMRWDPCTRHWKVQLYDDGFFGGSWHWYDVDPDDLVNNGVRGPNNEPDFMSIYERAYAQQHGGNAQDNKISGGFPENAQKSITGKDGDNHWRSLGGKPSVDDLAETLDSGGSAVVDTGHAPIRIGFVPLGDGPQHKDPSDVPLDKRLVPGHSYQVVSVDKEHRTVTLANPWGPEGNYGDESKGWGDKDKSVLFPGSVVLTEEEYEDWISGGSTLGSTK